jgi:hypothetical protein
MAHVHVSTWKNKLTMQSLGIIQATSTPEQVNKYWVNQTSPISCIASKHRDLKTKPFDNDGKLLTLAHEGIGL